MHYLIKIMMMMKLPLHNIITDIKTSLDVNDGVVDAPTATTTTKGILQLGRTNTIANANAPAVRNTVITSTVPTSGEDGVIYFVYAI